MPLERAVMKRSGMPRGAGMGIRMFLIVVGILGGSGWGPLAAYGTSAHGNPATGATRVPGLPAGSCGQCHVDGDAPVKFPKGLWRENDNDLCFSCHRDDAINASYPRREVYEISSHNLDPRTVWPGPYPPARKEIGAGGRCLQCHDPHGRADRNGVVPSLLIVRERELCLACHDGDPSARDIAREIRKPYSHPTLRSTDKHRADEGADPSRFSAVGGNRHAGCGDCHNAHAVAGDPAPPFPPSASRRNERVGRVRVVNGPAGSIPQYDFRFPNDTSLPVLEYEICFKCHSSWTRQPPGQYDMARLFNVNNASYHPVEGPGKNPGIDPRAFAGGKTAVSTIFCGDCHGSDDSDLRGPHGSRFPNILKRVYEARSDTRVTTPGELCFLCHNFDTYANPAALPAVRQASRFNPPASPGGHTLHVGERNVPCYACHDSHGSSRFPALIVTGRMPGILSFVVNAAGGTCTPTCHTARSYVVNYPR